MSRGADEVQSLLNWDHCLRCSCANDPNQPCKGVHSAGQPQRATRFGYEGSFVMVEKKVWVTNGCAKLMRLCSRTMHSSGELLSIAVLFEQPT